MQSGVVRGLFALNDIIVPGVMWNISVRTAASLCLLDVESQVFSAFTSKHSFTSHHVHLIEMLNKTGGIFWFDLLPSRHPLGDMPGSGFR
jgi:hypothetical protein